VAVAVQVVEVMPDLGQAGHTLQPSWIAEKAIL